MWGKWQASEDVESELWSQGQRAAGGWEIRVKEPEADGLPQSVSCCGEETMTMQLLGRKTFRSGLLRVQRSCPLSSWWKARWHRGRHGARGISRVLHLDQQEEKDTMSDLSLQTHPSDTSSDKATACK